MNIKSNGARLNSQNQQNLTRRTQNSLRRNKTNKNTQKNFYLNLTKEIINKLIYKFEYVNGTSGIKKDIMNERKLKNIHQYININIRSKVTSNCLFINYLMGTKDILLHLAIHFNFETFYKNQQSPLHFKQQVKNDNKITINSIVQKLRINSTDPFTFVLGTDGDSLEPFWREEAKVVLDVLNGYFNKNSKYYLFNNTNNTKNHPKLQILLNTMNEASRTIGIYRKNYK